MSSGTSATATAVKFRTQGFGRVLDGQEDRFGPFIQDAIGGSYKTEGSGDHLVPKPDQNAAKKQLRLVAAFLKGRFPQEAKLLLEAEEDILAHMAFPRAHWRRICSTNPLERLLRELGRRCDVVGIFPNRRAALWLIGTMLAEQQDEWKVGRRYFSQASMVVLDEDQERESAQEELAEEMPIG